MALLKLLKSMFAGPGAEAIVSDPVDYKGFNIEAAPLPEDGKYRVAGYISGELDGEMRRIQFIRADLLADQDAAITQSTTKARQIIDEQGQALLSKAQL